LEEENYKRRNSAHFSNPLFEPFSLSSSLKRINAKQLEDKRRGGDQDQDQRAVASLNFDCKLIHFENNKRILFPSQCMSYL
jgi:hypothetical protein